MEMTWQIDVHFHRSGNLVMATSPDHKGFNIAARSLEELEQKIPDAIRTLLEAEGKQVHNLQTRSEFGAESGWEPNTYFASAQLEAA